MISVPETRSKERIYVKNVKGIRNPKKGCGMGKMLSSTNHSGDAFL